MNLTGQVVLVHMTGYVPAAIQTFQSLSDPENARWNHAAIMVNQTECVGAEPGGAKLRPVTAFTDRVISRIPYTLKQRAIAARFAKDRIDTPYAYADIALIAVALLTKQATPAWLQHELVDDQHWICSALADAAVTAAGIHLFKDHRPSAAVYPANLAFELHARGWLRLPRLGKLKGWS